MPAATASCTVATHSSNVVRPHSMPSPPPPRVRVDTGGSVPNECCCIQDLILHDRAIIRHELPGSRPVDGRERTQHADALFVRLFQPLALAAAGSLIGRGRGLEGAGVAHPEVDILIVGAGASGAA